MISKDLLKIDGNNIIQRTRSMFRRRGAAKGLILTYHRVAEPGLDPWGLRVTPEHFAEQLGILNAFCHPMSLTEFVSAHQEKKIPDRAVVVTFDDGYVDNLHQAKPLLERYTIPAVVFLITAYIGDEREFWWDELGRALLQPDSLPEALCVKIQDHVNEWNLGRAFRYTQEERQFDQNRKPWQAVPGSRLAFFYKIWQQLVPLAHAERRKALDEILAWAGAEPGYDLTNRALSPEEVRGLAQGGLVEIGAHTVTHPSLPELPRAGQRKEIQRSKAQVEEVLGHPATLFSYPHGDYTRESAALVREAGFRCACTTITQCAWFGSDLFQLPRFLVEDWDGATFEKQISRWLQAS